MKKLSDYIQTDEMKNEKHVPAIECPDRVPAGEMFQIKVEIGKEIPHPNTTEHHIMWISLYYHGEGDKYGYEVGHFQFQAHGASVQGPNTGPVYTHHSAVCTLKISKPGVLHAMGYCNIHGLWQNTREIGIA